MHDCQLSVPKPQRQLFPVLNYEEANTLIQALINEPLWFRATVLLGLMLGLRRSEIIALRFSDIDWATGTITIRRTATQQTLNKKNTIILKPFTKNRKPKILTLTTQLRFLLQELLTKHQNNAKQFGASYDINWNDFVIRYEDGKLVPPNTVTQHFRSFIDKHNFKPLRFHDLRHSCASLLYANGIDIKTIQELMGHAHLTTTVMYTHTLSDRKTVALTQMHDQFLLPTVEELEKPEK